MNSEGTQIIHLAAYEQFGKTVFFHLFMQQTGTHENAGTGHHRAVASIPNLAHMEAGEQLCSTQMAHKYHVNEEKKRVFYKD